MSDASLIHELRTQAARHREKAANWRDHSAPSRLVDDMAAPHEADAALFTTAADRIAGLTATPDRYAEGLEDAAKVAEAFPLAQDHPDVGMMGYRDMEIAIAIRTLAGKRG